MATIVFDDSGGDGLWSNTANWVGGVLPAAADTADIDADCTLDMDDIVAVLDIASGITLTMGSGGTPYDITGMTGNCIGTGTIYMEAGCELKWNSASDYGPNGVNITARGTAWTAGNFCLLDNVGSGRTDWSSDACTIDGEFLKIHSIYRFWVNADVRLVNFELEGASSSSYVIIIGDMTLRNGWISNMDDASFGACALAYTGKATRHDIQNVTWGEDKDGNSQPNGADIGVSSSGNGHHTRMRNVRLTSTTQVKWLTDSYDSRLIIENLGYDDNDGTGDPGTYYVEADDWKYTRATAAAKSGTYGTRVTPKSTLSETNSRTHAEFEAYIPISSGDTVAVSIYGRRHTMTSDCAEIELDPEGAWFTPDTGATTLTTDDTWYEFTASGSTARGTAQKGMCRIVMRLKEYQASAYFDWADMVVTVT